MDRERWLREYWPLLVGVAVIVVGHVYLYGIQGIDWEPIGPPFMLALIVVVLIEIGRWAYGHLS